MTFSYRTGCCQIRNNYNNYAIENLLAVQRGAVDLLTRGPASRPRRAAHTSKRPPPHPLSFFQHVQRLQALCIVRLLTKLSIKSVVRLCSLINFHFVTGRGAPLAGLPLLSGERPGGGAGRGAPCGAGRGEPCGAEVHARGARRAIHILPGPYSPARPLPAPYNSLIQQKNTPVISNQ